MTSFWKEPAPPPPERMPKKRPAERKKSYGARVLAAVAGVALIAGGAVGGIRALRTGGGIPFMAVATLLPAIVLLRYAFTGVIKPN